MLSSTVCATGGVIPIPPVILPKKVVWTWCSVKRQLTAHTGLTRSDWIVSLPWPLGANNTKRSEACETDQKKGAEGPSARLAKFRGFLLHFMAEG